MADALNTHVVLLRGVMPTGKNKVPMAQLREVLTGAGFQNVRTYIQSGNVVLVTNLQAKEVQQKVHELIKNKIGADIKVIVRTGEQWQQVIQENPFIHGYDLSRVFFVLFAETPPQQIAEELMANDYGEEKLLLDATSGYMYIPGNAARSKLSNVMLEKKLGVAATTRNFNTMNKLVEMSGVGV
jgi:uncharacterized protein (DUF1697 family)